MTRDSFVFYKSFFTSINEIPEEYQLRAYKTLIEYALDGVLPDDNEPWIIKAIFEANKINIDNSRKAYEDGKRGGRPRKNPEGEETKKRGVFENKKGGFSNKKGGLENSKTYVDVYKDVYVDEYKDVYVDNKDLSAKESSDKTDLFSRFWTAYPKKTGKEAARKAFEKLKPTPEELEKWLAAIEDQKQSRQWQDRQYIPYPATWLNGKRWQDVTEPAQQFVSGDLPF